MRYRDAGLVVIIAPAVRGLGGGERTVLVEGYRRDLLEPLFGYQSAQGRICPGTIRSRDAGKELEYDDAGRAPRGRRTRRRQRYD